jgi:myo-inositol-1(or 4)-monophosphatase
VQAAGGAWVPLDSQQIFPLKVGHDYSTKSFPTLVASSPELVPVFKPFLERQFSN